MQARIGLQHALKLTGDFQMAKEASVNSIHRNARQLYAGAVLVLLLHLLLKVCLGKGRRGRGDAVDQRWILRAAHINLARVSVGDRRTNLRVQVELTSKLSLQANRVEQRDSGMAANNAGAEHFHQ